jgi:hypothetical protein
MWFEICTYLTQNRKLMGLLDWWRKVNRLTVIARHVTVIEYHPHPKPARSIIVCIPVHHLLLTNKYVNMADVFKKTQKVPFTLVFNDDQGASTTDAVTEVTGTPTDAAVVSVVFNDGSNTQGFIVGNATGAAGQATVNFLGKNSLGEAIGGSVLVTTTDITPPPPVKPAKSIGITLGDPVDQ